MKIVWSQWSLTLEVRKSKPEAIAYAQWCAVAMEPDLGGQEKPRKVRCERYRRHVAMEPDLGGQEKPAVYTRSQQVENRRNGA